MNINDEHNVLTSKYILCRLIKFLLNNKKYLYLSLSTLLCISFLDILLPKMYGDAINYIKYTLETNKYLFNVGFLEIILSIIFVAIIRALLDHFRIINHAKLVQLTIKDIRFYLYNKIQKLSSKHQLEKTSGEIISRTTRDLGIIQEFFGQFINLSIDNIIFFIGALIMMFIININLTLIVFVTLIPTVFLMIKYSKKLVILSKTIRNKYAEVTTVIQENIAGIRIVKGFVQENSELNKFSNKINEFFLSVMESIKYWSSKIPFTQFLFTLNIPLVLIYGGILIINKEISIGDVTKFIIYLGGIGMRINRLSGLTTIIQNTLSSGEKVLEILDEKTDVPTVKNPVKFPVKSPKIEFRNVYFSYNKNYVLEDINLIIQQNEIIGIIGPTGAGKTTLINLLPRFFDPIRGKVLIDGIDITNFELKSLRHSIGIVFQESLLFSATIKENIAFGIPEISMDEIEKYAKIAQAHEFIMKLDQGYDTIIGERGVTLSGGQKQRISIARALIIKPKILILDNATSSVDSETETLIIKNILETVKETTCIILTQKISLIKYLNKIVVMDKGKIIDIGDHNNLIERCQIYKEMYFTQIGEETVIL